MGCLVEHALYRVVDSLKKSDSELGMGGDITRRNLIHDAGLAALGLSLHFEFRELPEYLYLAVSRDN